MAGTNWLATNVAYGLVLEYAHRQAGEARVRLAWQGPGMTNAVVIPDDRLQRQNLGPTGVSVDAAGKVWAGCYNSDTGGAG